MHLRLSREGTAYLINHARMAVKSEALGTQSLVNKYCTVNKNVYKKDV